MKFRLFSREEKKVIEDLRKTKAPWDPDVRALVAILDALEPRFNAQVAGFNLLNEAGEVLRKAHVSAVYRDIFGSGKWGVCRRTGLFGIGPTLSDAFKHVLIVDEKSLRSATRGDGAGSTEESSEEETEDS